MTCVNGQSNWENKIIFYYYKTAKKHIKLYKPSVDLQLSISQQNMKMYIKCQNCINLKKSSNLKLLGWSY